MKKSCFNCESEATCTSPDIGEPSCYECYEKLYKTILALGAVYGRDVELYRK